MVNQNYIFPTFFILGAQKAGTTWLHGALKQHPDIGFGLKKEVHYFDDKSKVALGPEWYAAQFAHNAAESQIGDSTPKYLRMVVPEIIEADARVPQDAILQLKALCPNPKFIVLLREPVSRALSSHFMRIGRRTKIHWRGILKVSAQADTLKPGKYAEQLEIWFEHFPRENFLILFYEECLVNDESRIQTIKKVCEFLGVTSEFQVADPHELRNARPSDFVIFMGRFLGRFTKHLEKTPNWIQNLPIWKIKVSDADMKYMQEYFVEPNQRLAKLLGRELPW